LICNFNIRRFVDNQSVDNFDEIVEKIDFDKHYSNNEIEKIVVETIEIETIVVEIAIDDCYCYIDRIVVIEHFV
jgi:hypothetical protein